MAVLEECYYKKSLKYNGLCLMRKLKKIEQIKISECKLKGSSVKVELHLRHEMNSTEEWWWLL